MFGRGLLPGDAAIDGRPGRAVVAFDGELLRRFDADVDDGVSAVGADGWLDFNPGGAVVLGVEEAKAIAKLFPRPSPISSNAKSGARSAIS